MPQKTIYLDHAAATYLDPRVTAAMAPFWEANYGNPSSLHHVGREAATALGAARATVAAVLNTKPSEIIFTAGGTESINLAIFGVAGRAEKPGHIITSVVEHSAVLQSCAELERCGWIITRLPVDRDGFVSLQDLKNAIRPETILISVMYANNEVGTVEPIEAVGAWLKKLNKERVARGEQKIIFHTDACQAVGALTLDVQKLGVDLMTINGSKIYGPKQTGALYCKTGLVLKPTIYGGGQEWGLRSGTENIPGIVGLATALKLAGEGCQEERRRLRQLRNYFIDRVLNEIPDVILNGPREAEESPAEPRRLPNNINLSFKGVDGEALLLYLDHRGICVSAGSACAAKHGEASHVLPAIGCPEEFIGGSARLTLGKRTTKADLDFTLKILTETVKQLRSAGEK